MKRIVCLLTILLLAAGICGAAAAEDSLQNIKKRGVLRAGVKDLTPSFALADIKTGEISGYDVDFVRAIARRLDVRLEITPFSGEENERISFLTEGKVDIVAATMTITREREKLIDFSHPYFVTAQKFLVHKDTVQRLSDLKNKQIGTVDQTTSVENLRKALPSASIVLFTGYVPAFLSLQNRQIFAVSTDEAILAGILAKSDKDVFEIPKVSISREPYGLGVRKGQTSFLRFVNQALLEMEHSGEAKRIFDKWFGPESSAPLERTFRITAK
ncbi:MAG: transporter substrate-binding domain-containing protein [Smithellaceae bacterium]|jgi:polar amino acid transport system substrate-binding protein|nr:transporter substrate-binding domain-containing protein [Smithellaceae bacterium]MDD3258815.1 transporter substrate-binding domain-containing protein [Smithellaceae bacterium]MDD3848788.1 transporter substrate-binding domain-containing protein [Smithellaceae bacterium]HOG11442.1 transporter substrate-binding domain-containing protein [Smithellaceae bacterium]HOQ71317.1 transporter substrate-binding domain-containing protein [Smithellaceae bacterium]